MALYTGPRRRILPPLVFGAGVLWHLLRHGRSYDVVHTCAFPYFSLLAAALARPFGRYRLVVDWFEVWSSEYWRGYLGGLGGRVGELVQRACARVPQRAFCFSLLHAERLRELGLRGSITVLRGLYAGAKNSEPARAQGEDPLPFVETDPLVETSKRVVHRTPPVDEHPKRAVHRTPPVDEHPKRAVRKTPPVDEHPKRAVRKTPPFAEQPKHPVHNTPPFAEQPKHPVHNTPPFAEQPKHPVHNTPPLPNSPNTPHTTHPRLPNTPCTTHPPLTNIPLCCSPGG